MSIKTSSVPEHVEQSSGKGSPLSESPSSSRFSSSAAKTQTDQKIRIWAFWVSVVLLIFSITIIVIGNVMHQPQLIESCARYIFPITTLFLGYSLHSH